MSKHEIIETIKESPLMREMTEPEIRFHASLIFNYTYQSILTLG